MVRLGTWLPRSEERRQAGACNDERQRQACDQAYQRARSGLKLMVNMIEGEKANIHAECHTLISGQLRFLGLLVLRVFGVFGDGGFDQLAEFNAALDRAVVHEGQLGHHAQLHATRKLRA